MPFVVEDVAEMAVAAAAQDLQSTGMGVERLLRPEQHTARSEILTWNNQESQLGSTQGENRFTKNDLSAGLPLPGLAPA
jgi:hypothetical protein